jgi:acetyl esterase
MELAYCDLMMQYLAVPAMGPITRTERVVPSQAGDVPVRIHTPDGAGPHPVLVHLFGGAWWQRTYNAPDVVGLCRDLAEAGVAVVQVDYALAPERPYPVALEQIYDVVTWIAAGEVPSVDPARIAIGGISAGGNLAAAVSLMARDRRGPRIALQVLEVPVLDLTLSLYDDRVHDSFPFVPGVPPASRAPLQEGVDWYLAGGHSPLEAYVSPLRAPDLQGLPEALILVAEFDPLAAEGRAYAAALNAVGTPATAVTYAGQVHAAPTLGGISLSSRRWRAQVGQAIKGMSAAL